jgi:hypothetical protein
MSLWSIVQIGLAVIAFLLAFAGDKLSNPILLYAGISIFGIAAIMVGMEAMITRHIVLYRQRNYSETYLGIAAYAQGVQFSIIGIFLIGVSIMGYLDSGRDLFLHLIQRPWSVLVMFGVSCLMQAVIALGGSVEQKQGTRWVVILDFFVGRLLPGIILVAIGFGALGLGLLEFVMPAQFDALGGGFLEALFGV